PRQAVAAEGNRPRTRRDDPRAPVHGRRRRVRAAAARLLRKGEPQGVPLGSARCAQLACLRGHAGRPGQVRVRRAVDEEGCRVHRRVGTGAPGARRRNRRGDRAREVVPQPGESRRHPAVRGRGGRGRLGARAARQRGRARGRAGEGLMSLHPNEVLLSPVVSEKSYSLIEDRKYSFRVHKDAQKTQVRQAVEQLFGVKVISVNMVKVPSKPKMRNYRKGTRPGWKKAIVQLKEGDAIEIFEGAQV